MKERKLQIKWGIVCLLIPAVLFYLMESYEHNPFTEVRQTAQWFNVLLFELAVWILFFLIGKGRWAVRIVTLAAMIFGLVNHYVMLFRNTPFVPWDVFSVRTAASVAKGYDFTPSVRVVLVTIGFVTILVLTHWIKFDMETKFYIRLIPVVVLSLGLGVFVNRLWDDNFQLRNYLYPFLFTPGYMTKVNGMTVTFVMDLEYVRVDKPEGYNSAKAAEKLSEYSPDPVDQVLDGEKTLPNIIVVMDEAFSDLAVLDEFDTNEDYMPFVHSLLMGADNTISGQLNVSVCGGNTANSEYEFLTGNSMAYLPVGSIPYQQYIRGVVPTMTWHLKDLGYATYAQHPYNAAGWNRDKVYKWFGFDELSFIRDYVPRKYIRDYVSDETDFDHIIKTFKNKEEGVPAFIFNVTMQNHGGYTDTYPDFDNSITAVGKDSDVLDQYLSLIKITDTQFERLIEYFSGVEEDTVIVFFGDHQPNGAVANPVKKTEADDTDRYLVPFVIWANFDIPEETGVETSLNFLGAKVLEAAGVPKNDYENFLLELEKDYSVISAVKTVGESDADMLKWYKKIQYYQMFDRENN